jgi:fatty acid desaturase
MQRRRDQVELSKHLLPPDDPRLRELAHKRPGRVILDALRSYAIILCAFWLLYVEPRAAVLCFLMIGTQQYALYILGHDGTHSNLARDRSWNDRLTTAFLYAPFGTQVRSAREGHLKHHRTLGTEEDPDRKIHTSANKRTSSEFVVFLLGLTTLPMVLGRVLAFKGRGTVTPTVSSPGGGLRARVPVLIAQALVFAAIWALFPAWYYLVFWMLPVYSMVFLSDQLRAFCEHAQLHLSDAEGDAQRLTTFRPNWLERTLFAPHNMCHHAEHHLWPFIPYYNLPAAAALVRGCPEIEVRTSYAAYVLRHFRRLNRHADPG